MSKSTARPSKPTISLLEILKAAKAAPGSEGDPGVTITEICQTMEGGPTTNNRRVIANLLRKMVAEGAVVVGRGNRVNLAGGKMKAPVYRRVR